MRRPAQHGSCARYELDGCRCPLCKHNHNERVKRNRRERLESGLLSHGTRSAYDAGCRCPECAAARRDAYRRLSTEYPRRKGES